MTSKYNDVNPLPSCPDTPNCIRTAQLFHTDTTAVLRSLNAIFKNEAEEFDANEDSLSVHAVYKIPVFGWKDDVYVQLKAETQNKTIVFIRSSSREGYSDLGVNSRRVKRILRKTENELKP